MPQVNLHKFWPWDKVNLKDCSSQSDSNSHLVVLQEINIEFGNEKSVTSDARREVPVWITESTVTTTTNNDQAADSKWTESTSRVETPDVPESLDAAGGHDNEDEITTLLLRHEKRSGPQKLNVAQANESDSDK